MIGILNSRAGHFRYKYRYFDIRYLSDTEKSIEISDLKSMEYRVSYYKLSLPIFDTPTCTGKRVGLKKYVLKAK
jgi:hypothetical protein